MRNNKQTAREALAIIAMSVCIISSAHCQETIPGSVLDGDTKQGIPYAAVHLMGSYSGTSCNEAGQFVLHVPKGKYRNMVLQRQEDAERQPFCSERGAGTKLHAGL